MFISVTKEREEPPIKKLEGEIVDCSIDPTVDGSYLRREGETSPVAEGGSRSRP